jgi:hypothetical protein
VKRIAAGCAGVSVAYGVVGILEGYSAQWAIASGVWLIVSILAGRDEAK